MPPPLPRTTVPISHGHRVCPPPRFLHGWDPPEPRYEASRRFSSPRRVLLRPVSAPGPEVTPIGPPRPPGLCPGTSPQGLRGPRGKVGGRPRAKGGGGGGAGPSPPRRARGPAPPPPERPARGSRAGSIPPSPPPPPFSPLPASGRASSGVARASSGAARRVTWRPGACVLGRKGRGGRRHLC